MLTKMNKLMKSNAFTTSELALTCAMMLAFAGGIQIFVKRQAGQVVEHAAMFSAANNGLGQPYDQIGFEPTYDHASMQKGSFGTSGLDVATDSLTTAVDLTNTGSGTKSTDGTE